MQNLYHEKKVLFLFTFIILILLILLSILVINNFSTSNETKTLANKIRQFANEKTSDSKPPERIEVQLAKLSNKSTSAKEKYQAISIIGFYFSDAYSQSHDPEIRKFSAETISPYAKKKFPDFYQEVDFVFTCADPTCGQKLSSEILRIFALLDESSVEDYYVKTIKENLTTAGYIPSAKIEEKKVGFSLVYDQLLRVGDPKASEAAEVLKNYSKQKYNFGL